MAALAILAVLPQLDAQSKPKAAAKITTPAPPAFGNADSITQDELKTFLYFLASDQLEGRNLPSRGFDIAALYVASHLAEWGLRPGGSASDTNGPLQPYLMPFDLVTKQVIAESAKASMTAPPAADVAARALDPAKMPGRVPPISNTPKSGPFPPADAALRRSNPSTPRENWSSPETVMSSTRRILIPIKAWMLTAKSLWLPGFPVSLPRSRVAVEAAGVDRIRSVSRARISSRPKNTAARTVRSPSFTSPIFSSLRPWRILTAAGAGRGGGGRGLNGPTYQPPKLRAPEACRAVPSITAGLSMTDAIFQGEKKSGADLFYAAGSNTKPDSFDLNAAKTMKLHVPVKSESSHAENVVGILEGADPVRKNEYIVISAHLDHIGLSVPLPNGHNVNNGADDDGSGSVSVMAMARAFAEGAAKGMRPARSIIFLWNAGEEKGLWGSQYFAEYPPVDPTKIVADLNIDMIGRTKSPGSTDPDPTHVLVNPGEVLLIGPNISSDDLEKTIETVNNGYQKLTLNHFYDATAPDATHDNLGPQPNGQRVFYRSDHYNFAKIGVPIAFFTTGLHPDYHRPTDTPDKIDYKQMQIISKTVTAVAWTLANAGRPPGNQNHSARSIDQRHENGEGAGLGQSYAGNVPAARSTVAGSTRNTPI